MKFVLSEPYLHARQAATTPFFPQDFIEEVWQTFSKQDGTLKLLDSLIPADHCVRWPAGMRGPTEEMVAGFDLPILVGEGNRPIVMIIGQDPFRSDKEAERYSPDRVLLSTPFGVHSPDGMKSSRLVSYAIIIHSILDAGYDVYVTDVAKMYLRDLTTNKRVAPRSAANTIYNGILKNEIGALSPANVFCFGGIAKKACSRIGVGPKLMGLYHPKARELNHIPGGASAPNRGRYLAAQIMAYLKPAG